MYMYIQNGTTQRLHRNWRRGESRGTSSTAIYRSLIWHHLIKVQDL
uniref:Uncharacterized protein n=1 Tax=Anguilla anguilla TaxID=7936 RepID=A0A0E9RD35_ANGAN